MERDGVMAAGGPFTQVTSFSELAYLVSSPVSAPAFNIQPEPTTSTPDPSMATNPVSTPTVSTSPIQPTTPTSPTTPTTSGPCMPVAPSPARAKANKAARPKPTRRATKGKMPNIKLSFDNLMFTSTFDEGPSASAKHRNVPKEKPVTDVEEPALPDLKPTARMSRQKTKKSNPPKPPRTQELERMKKSRDQLKTKFSESQAANEALRQQVSAQIKTMKAMENEITALKERVKSMASELLHAKSQIPGEYLLLFTCMIDR